MLSSTISFVLSNSGNLQRIVGFNMFFNSSDFSSSEDNLYNNSFVHNDGDMPHIKK